MSRSHQDVGFLVGRFPQLTQTFVLHEFLELRRQGVPIRMLSVGRTEETVCHDEARLLRAEVTYLREVGLWRRVVALVHALRHYPAGVVRALVQLARQHDARTVMDLIDALVLVHLCDVDGVRHVHAHFATVPAAISHLAHELSGLSFSFTAHARDIYVPPPRLLAQRVAAARAVVTCTDANREHFERVVGVAPGTVQVLRHGLPLQPFLDVPRRPVLGRLLTVGRVVPKKGYDTIAHALAQLVGEGRDVHWHVVGIGELRGELAQLITDLGVDDRVEFRGSLTSAQVRDELGAAQAFVLAPRVLADGNRDGVPNVFLESMAAGVPVVATPVSGIPEVLRDGETGLLVEPDDPPALAAALARLLDDTSLAEGIAIKARSWAIDNCNLERSVAPLATMLRDLGSPDDRVVPEPRRGSPGEPHPESHWALR